MAHGRTMGLHDDDALATSARFVQRVIVRSSAAGRAIGRSLRLIPLKLGEKVVGVLRLRVLEDPRRLLREERLEEEHAQAHLVAARAALSRLDELATEERVPQDALTHLRSHYEQKLRTLTEAMDSAGEERFDGHVPVQQRLRQEGLPAERAAVIGLRDQGRIDDETLRLVEREGDLEEQRLH